jgi:prenyltransferase beta subunit
MNDISNVLIKHHDICDKPLTIKEYLKRFLLQAWGEKECFSGKRPFGNSDFYHKIYEALVRANKVKGVIDENDYLAEVDQKEADRLIVECIKSW